MIAVLRRVFMAVPPLALGGVLLIHPNDQTADTIYESIRPVVDDWILVHVACPSWGHAYPQRPAM